LLCSLTKAGSEIRVFQDLLTQLNRRGNLTGRKESNSVMRSLERATVAAGVIHIVDYVNEVLVET